MRMKYTAQVRLEIVTFVECEGNDLLIDKAMEKLKAETMNICFQIEKQTGHETKVTKMEQICGRPVKEEK